MTLPPRRVLLPLAGIVLGLLLIAAGYLAEGFMKAPSAASGIGGRFALLDQTGRPRTDADFKGEPMLVFFGYTHCPDVCPTALSDLTEMLKDIGPDKKAQVLFVTVDPERDTPAVMKDYLSSFDPRIVGLTGTPEAIEAMLKAYRVFARKVPGEQGDYTVDHTGIIYLMDRDGNFVQSFNAEIEKPKEAAAAFGRYM